MKKPEYTTICKNGVTYMMRNGICKNISNVDDSVEEVTFGDGIDIININSIPEVSLNETPSTVNITVPTAPASMPNTI